MKINVNGKIHDLQVDPETPLLWVLRDHLGLTGAKYSCGLGQCGACTVHINGKPELSCTMPVSQVGTQEVVTIEGVDDSTGLKVKQAWLKEQVPQCGYCQPGQIMTAIALLRNNPNPTDKMISNAMSGVLCRCGTYLEIIKAIKTAAENKKNG